MGLSGKALEEMMRRYGAGDKLNMDEPVISPRRIHRSSKLVLGQEKLLP